MEGGHERARDVAAGVAASSVEEDAKACAGGEDLGSGRRARSRSKKEQVERRGEQVGEDAKASAKGGTRGADSRRRARSRSKKSAQQEQRQVEDDLVVALSGLHVGSVPGAGCEKEREQVAAEAEQGGKLLCGEPLFRMPSADKLRAAKKLLVLDVNGLLLQRVRGPVPTGVKRRPDATLRGVKVFERPNMKPFVHWCLNHFDVAVWSSAKRENVELLASFVFGTNFREKTAFVWNQDQCSDTGLMHPQDRHKPVVLKELSLVWQHPHLNRTFDRSNTLLIDDSPYKACMNPPHTAIHPPAWTCDMDDDEMLLPGSTLTDFLKGLASAPHVPDYVARRDPFNATTSLEQDLIAAIRARKRRPPAHAPATRPAAQAAPEIQGIDGLVADMGRLGVLSGRGRGGVVEGRGGRGGRRGAGVWGGRGSGAASSTVTRDAEVARPPRRQFDRRSGACAAMPASMQASSLLLTTPCCLLPPASYLTACRLLGESARPPEARPSAPACCCLVVRRRLGGRGVPACRLHESA